MAKKGKWERVLYRNFSFADNYSDEAQFLNQLRKNVNVVHYTLAESVRGACMLMCHVDVVALYFCVFEFVQMEYVNSRGLLAFDSLLVVLCGVLYLVMGAESLTYDLLADHLRTSVTLVLFGYGFTPIIRTLTTSISTDSIYAVSFGLFFFSLVFHDYGLDAPVVSSTFSANLSLAASVFLISRVSSDPLAFYLLALSLCAFCFWPRLRNMFLLRYDNLPLALLVVLCPISLALINVISTPLAIIYAALHIFLVVACPLILMEMQKYKSTIHGPWDEASLNASFKN